ncbi:amino acid synthesis family protein, partial [Candidatus Pelagibacter sp.]|nr:amino acid synthesis family protein [Candidatus Pelagibacter sp.]
MNINLRKFTKFVDKTYIEGGKKAKEPVLLVSVAAVFKNPWHG